MTTASNDIPITVLCADKSGKNTPYELLMKQNVTIGEVRSYFFFVQNHLSVFEYLDKKGN